MPVVRDRGVGRGAARGSPGLSTATALLRPVLEAAIAVARDGERATPPAPAPAQLRRYLSFARLPDPALDVARRVLDDDESFRARVSEAVAEEEVGRAAWLWLTRPDGWEGELHDLEQQAAAAERSAKEERSEKAAQRRLAGAEAALARSEAALRASTEEAEQARAELREERLAARSLAAEVERLRAALDDLTADRAGVVHRVKELEATLAERSSDARQLRHEVRMLQAEMAQAAGATDSESARVLPPLLAQAAETAAQLSAILADAVGAVGGPESAGAVSPRRRGPRHAARTRRSPLRLPPGVFDDAPAAAEYLVRVSGVLVLVDGYNVSHVQWATLSPAEQRARLLDLCAELHARAGTEVEVVFDGAGDHDTAGTLPRSDVRYRFTPAGVEADDVLLARVDDEPADRPVVVVSSDGRVREGARLRGANVVGGRQFLLALRR